MARNFKHRYYLVCNDKLEGEALKILYNDQMMRDFKDISTLDLATLGLQGNKKQILGEYNPDSDLYGNLIVVSSPHSDGQKQACPALFDFEDEKSKYYIDNLRYFAEQRHEKVKNGDLLGLDRDSRLEQYTFDLMDDILRSNDKRLLSEQSLISKPIKELIRDKSINQGTESFINSHSRIRNIFANYTQLRLMTYSYLLSIMGYNPEIRSQFEKLYPKSNIKNLEPLDPEPTQMTMDSFIDDPRLKLDLRLMQNNSKKRANRH